MLKSYRQQAIEAEYGGKDIKTILLEALEKHRGTKQLLLAHVALELGVNPHTAENWCGQFGIDLNAYRRLIERRED